jgi:hypothetical protein
VANNALSLASQKTTIKGGNGIGRQTKREYGAVMLSGSKQVGKFCKLKTDDIDEQRNRAANNAMSLASLYMPSYGPVRSPKPSTKPFVGR